MRYFSIQHSSITKILAWASVPLPAASFWRLLKAWNVSCERSKPTSDQPTYWRQIYLSKLSIEFRHQIYMTNSQVTYRLTTSETIMKNQMKNPPKVVEKIIGNLLTDNWLLSADQKWNEIKPDNLQTISNYKASFPNHYFDKRTKPTNNWLSNWQITN